MTSPTNAVLGDRRCRAAVPASSCPTGTRPRGVMTVSGTGSPRPGWNTRSSLHRASPKPLSSARPTRCPGQGVVAFVILRGSATDSRSVGLPQFGHDEDLLRSADRLHVVCDVRLQLHDQRVGSRVPYVDPQRNGNDHRGDGARPGRGRPDCGSFSGTVTTGLHARVRPFDKRSVALACKTPHVRRIGFAGRQRPEHRFEDDLGVVVHGEQKPATPAGTVRLCCRRDP